MKPTHDSSAFRSPRVAVTIILLATFGALDAVPASAGPVGLQASGGWYTEGDEFFLGAGARVGLGTITVIPNFEWLFVDSGSTYTLNVDGTMSVMPMSVASGYVGAGVGRFTVDPERGDSDSETVINLIAGVGLNAVPLRPFAQLKWVVLDGDDPLVFAFGARF